MVMVGAMGVESGMGEPLGSSSSDEESSGSLGGTSTIPDVDGVWTVGVGGRSVRDFVEAEGLGLAVVVGRGAGVDEVAAAFFDLG